MSIPSVVANAANGDNMIGHVATAATLGNGLTAIVIWIFELFHIMPPEGVQAGFGVICAIGASWILRRVTP